jgi:hypothetical protein
MGPSNCRKWILHNLMTELGKSAEVASRQHLVVSGAAVLSIRLRCLGVIELKLDGSAIQMLGSCAFI